MRIDIEAIRKVVCDRFPGRDVSVEPGTWNSGVQIFIYGNRQTPGICKMVPLGDIYAMARFLAERPSLIQVGAVSKYEKHLVSASCLWLFISFLNLKQRFLLAEEQK